MEKEYVIICTDQLSTENSFLFWKPEGRGYTCDINKAGSWRKKPDVVRDVVIEKKKLLEMHKPRTIVGDSMLQIFDLQVLENKSHVKKEGKK